MKASEGVSVYAAPQVASSQITARIEGIRNACTARSGETSAQTRARGGDVVQVGFYSGSTLVGKAIYAHLDVNPATRQRYANKENVSRWGWTLGTVGSYVRSKSNTCWTGLHLHVELWSAHSFACYNTGWEPAQKVFRTNFFGFIGGNYASAIQQSCPGRSGSPNASPPPANGSFIKGSGPTVYYVEDGRKRRIVNESSWYALGGRPQTLIHLTQARLAAIPDGPPISARFADGTYVKASGPNIYYIKEGQRHYVPNVEVWRSLGGTDANLKLISDTALAEIPEGPPLPTGSPQAFPDGSFLKASGPDVYVIEAGAKRRIVSESAWYALGGGPSNLQIVADAVLASILDGAPISATFPDGTFLKGGGPNIYYIESGRKRYIPTVAAWHGLGGNESNLRHVSDQALSELPDGPPIPT